MILFLDIVSPFPEFSVINKNKIIQSIQVLNKKDNKISDSIILKFIKAQKKLQLEKKINKLVVCTGPGSYTALRVGISFMYGLSISTKIPLLGISCPELLQFAISKSNQRKTLMFISSSNQQNYICTQSNRSKKYIIKKINDKLYLNNTDYLKYKYSISNYKISKNVIKKFDLNNHQVIKLREIVKYNLKEILSLPVNEIIKPIYISENKILN